MVSLTLGKLTVPGLPLDAPSCTDIADSAILLLQLLILKKKSLRSNLKKRTKMLIKYEKRDMHNNSQEKYK